MSKAISTTNTPEPGHKTPAVKTVATLLLGATALAAASAPVSAADIDVDASLVKYINSDKTAHHYVLNAAAVNSKHWEVLDVKVKNMRAPAINIKRPVGAYKIIAAKAVAQCPDPVFGDPPGSVMQQVEFIKSVATKTSVTKSESTAIGQVASVEVSVGYGIGPVKGDSKVGFSVNHTKKKGESNTTSTTKSKTLRERVQVKLDGVGGKWAVLWARVHKDHELPYTAVFEPHPEDMVSFKIRNTGQVCLHKHVGLRGTKHCFKSGDNVPKLSRYNFNDDASSISGTQGLSAVYYKHADYKGQATRISGNRPELHGWAHDSFSSLQVEPPKWVDVKYRLFKEGLKKSERQFRVRGKISIDMTQATETRLVSVPMKKAEFDEYCALSSGYRGTKSKRAASTGSGKRSGPVVADVPAAKLAKMKFKAPK